MTQLSVIIPTHKRAEILRRCIERLELQTIADQIEVIVVSDGHDAETANLFRNAKWKTRVQFFEIEKSQHKSALMSCLVAVCHLGTFVTRVVHISFGAPPDRTIKMFYQQLQNWN